MKLPACTPAFVVDHAQPVVSFSPNAWLRGRVCVVDTVPNFVPSAATIVYVIVPVADVDVVVVGVHAIVHVIALPANDCPAVVA